MGDLPRRFFGVGGASTEFPRWGLLGCGRSGGLPREVRSESGRALEVRLLGIRLAGEAVRCDDATPPGRPPPPPGFRLLGTRGGARKSPQLGVAAPRFAPPYVSGGGRGPSPTRAVLVSGTVLVLRVVFCLGLEGPVPKLFSLS